MLTGRGGKTSHAAVVARGMGRVCVCGAEALEIDEHAGVARVITGPGAGTVIRTGQLISIDGASGAVYGDEVAVIDSPLARYFDGRRAPPAP